MRACSRRRTPTWTSASLWARLGPCSLFVWALGCGGGGTVELAAARGCGLDQEFSGLRVRVLGDFPASSGSEVLLGPGEQGVIPALPDAATGLAAEGLFGATTTAIGRSWGTDPELARGRVPGFDPSAAILSVMFAAPDSLCVLDEQPAPRDELAAAAGPAGDVLLAGGVEDDGAPVDSLVHVDLFSGAVRSLDARLPGPLRGHSVHALDGRRFLILGGAGPSGVSDRRVEVEIEEDGLGLGTGVGAGEGDAIVEAQLLTIEGEVVGVSDHASARSALDGRILVAGGCDVVDGQGRCAEASALARSYWIDPEAPDASARLPDLARARRGAFAWVSQDGVAWVAGGLGVDGGAEASVERLGASGGWELVHSLDAGASVTGFAVLDGGLVVLAEASGAIHWWSEAGAGVLDASGRAPPLAPAAASRPMLALPGERVLVDSWLFTPGSAAVDPASGRVQLADTGRTGALALALADGSSLIVGGHDEDGELWPAPLSRLRPRLDGPDEWIPELTGNAADAFVTMAPGQATVTLGGLSLAGIGGELDALPPVRAHVRGFRSRELRLELELEVDDPSAAVAHVSLGQGAEALVDLAFIAGAGVTVRRRGVDGVEALDCVVSGEVGPAIVVELDDDARRLQLSSDAIAVADCELDWPSTAGIYVGFGVSGTGTARFSGLRLARR